MPTQDMTVQDQELGQRLTALTIGMDQLERRLSRGHGVLDSEGLVPIYLGQDLVPTPNYQDWEEVHSELAALDDATRQLGTGPRRAFLEDMLRSLRTAARLFEGEELSFKEKLEQLVGVPAEPVSDDVIHDLQATIDALLVQAGYVDGTLAQRVQRWEADGAVAAGDLGSTFTALMREAQERTDALIYPTGDYTMALNEVRGVPFTARCNFNAGQMDLNVDLNFTRSALKHLVCHEVFPGHSTQLLYTRDAAERGESTADVLLCTANAVTGCVQEGIGDQGVHLIDWVEDTNDAIHMTLRRLRSSSATSAAWYQMGAGWSEDRVRAFLEASSFGQRVWIDGRIRFASYSFRGPFIASYWHGDEAVRTVRERIRPDQRAAFIETLYGQMHSPRSLMMFQA
ncbi:hypothetical protein HNQ07_002065 [Deinococcus metalli]|uniref:DUF885 domain-containing protein n=1 Tax=Deinococcus metalli TaxID=1141878 RepID=A0A7W8KED1_9DEIO|nr:hypothetical protein [Deinococcus metalli]MBB5376601.1 hypothetical protein [Deinococcus metalli]GHF42862.1 hypothetical protein GCM10017781_19010 [Deinococcus metalli]